MEALLLTPNTPAPQSFSMGLIHQHLQKNAPMQKWQLKSKHKLALLQEQ